jgi:retinol dehydrogenase-16
LYSTLFIFGLYIVYILLDRILRIPYISDYRCRYILITGCTSGLGFDTAKRLDSLGCHVFAGYRREGSLDELKKVCSERLMPIQIDVSNPESVRKALKVVTDRLAADGQELWGVINNAGVGGMLGNPEWMRVDDYRRTNDVNLYGMIDVTMTFLPLIKRSRGRIVNVSSVLGILAIGVSCPYSVSKHGIEAFSDGLRRSLRPYGCKVSVVQPAEFRTRMTSREVLGASFDQPWNRLESELKEEFGEEYHNKVKNGFLDQYNTAPDSLDEVVDAYEQALFSRYPRFRYRCGLNVKLVFALQSVLPDWSIDWITERIAPFLTAVPAALQKSKKTKTS